MGAERYTSPGAMSDVSKLSNSRSTRPLFAGVRSDRSVSLWLHGLWAFVFAMVAVGGMTRLTGSGLSMVDWRPLMGTLPPLSQEAWLGVFEQYKQSPQFVQVNHWMGLTDFKRIFMWEYGHRLLGRLIGLAFAVPFAYFLLRGRLRGGAVARTLAAFVLGGAQGVLGWYMVQSGLVNRPEVSHFRLAAHLSLAFFVGQYLLWLALSFRGPPDGAHAPDVHRGRPHTSLFLAVVVLWGLLAAQVVLGAFMAGTHAGLLSATFPDMNGSFAPAPFFRFPSLVANLLHNPLAIHWSHRALGFAVLGVGGVLAMAALRRNVADTAKPAAIAMLSALVLQFVLGASTVVFGVPIALAVAHQLGAYVLMSTAVLLGHRLFHSR